MQDYAKLVANPVYPEEVKEKELRVKAQRDPNAQGNRFNSGDGQIRDGNAGAHMENIQRWFFENEEEIPARPRPVYAQ